MEANSELFISQHLNELEIRFANGNVDGFEICFESVSDYIEKLPKAFLTVLKSITKHDYDQILSLNISDLDLKIIENEDRQQLPCVCFQENVADEPLLTYGRQLLLLFVGVSALQTFLRENSSGPPCGSNEDFPLCTSVFNDLPCDALLSENGEFVSDNAIHKNVFLLSSIFLSAASQIQGGSLTCGWWDIRRLFVHQRLLPDRVPRLHDQAVKLIAETSQSKWINEEENSLSKLLFSIEASQLHLYYHEVSSARKLVDSAKSLAGLDINLGGAYGKRTYFQQKAVAQLTVKLGRTRLLGGALPMGDCYVPKDLQLEDDTVLNKVSFTDIEANEVESLSPEEQIVLLGHCLLVKRSEASDLLLQEQVMSYVNCLLDQPKVWSIYITALILRCKLEKERSRRIERSLMQLESVVDSLRGKEPPFSKRALMLFSTAFPMMWTLEKELADVQLSIGATKSALAIYEKLKLWQDVVLCLQLLGRTSQAETVVREQLQKQETPLLWCLLGDILDDPEMYLKADELSNGKNARCQRALGYYYFKRKDWKQCIFHFNKSLEINHLQSGVWYSLGYATIQVEDYAQAAKAYRQVVILDPDNFEAWNNLSNAYIRTKQKDRAWRALQEALKCNYEEWRVWENFLVVSVDLGAFEEVIRSWHRLIDIKGKYLDPEVLNILVRAINEDLPDMCGHPTSRLRKQALELLGRISSVVPNDCCIWRCYSALQCPDIDASSDVESVEKALLHQQKAMRHCNLSGPGDFESFKRVLEVVGRSVELTLKLAHLLEAGDTRIGRYKASTRLTAQSMVTKVKNGLGDLSSEDSDKLKELLEPVQKLLGELQAL
ncbi:hypothetical protein JTE90_000901 [Oedothorax gibbosus]|uniref:Tetratricopeptide repeat protein 27 n=1 Tax=Oedothorax gibbosus TaxID=931172 RepID=A0AAV6VVN0_9ARAC|nr:hypothetical protein JTE90_000901 [Oedothorax gibbosus]